MEETLRFGLFFAFIGLEYFRKGSQAKTIIGGINDKYSTSIISIALTIAIVLSPLLNMLQIGIVFAPSLFWIGIICAASGTSIRFWAMKSLGEFYTRILVITKNHDIIDFGPYALVRHPGYFGSTLFWFGISLSTHNLIATFLVLILILSAYIYRMKVEEEMLLEAFGKGYKDYMKKTKKLIPFLY